MDSMTANVRTSPKKARKPQRRSLALRYAIAAVAAEYDRMSVRQLFYQLVSRGVVEKTERAYKRVCDAAVQMRLDGSLDFRKVTDGHRSRRLVYAHSSLHEALQSAHDLYRRNYWLDQPRHVEVWCEKDALSGVIAPVCDRYGVPYVATRGFPSITLLYDSAQAMAATGKPATVFYFGDHDASGHSISDGLEKTLRHFGVDVTVTRVALNPDLIHTYALPTRPGKLTDSRQAGFAARFGGASVELDALPPDLLTALVERSIASEIDREAWRRVSEIEALEADTLESIALAGWVPGVWYAAPEDAA
jgi:hypothetical protein